MKSEEGKCFSGGKHSKVRLTGLVAGTGWHRKKAALVCGRKVWQTTLFQWYKKFTSSLLFSEKELDGWKFVYRLGEGA